MILKLEINCSELTLSLIHISSQAITKLINLAPKTAVRLTDGVEQEIPLEMVQAGDVYKRQ